MRSAWCMKVIVSQGSQTRVKRVCHHAQVPRARVRQISRNVASTAADWCGAGCCKDAAVGRGATGRTEAISERRCGVRHAPLRRFVRISARWHHVAPAHACFRSFVTFARFADAHSGTTLSSLAHHPRPPGPPVCGPRRLALGACVPAQLATRTTTTCGGGWRVRIADSSSFVSSGRPARGGGKVCRHVMNASGRGRRRSGMPC